MKADIMELNNELVNQAYDRREKIKTALKNGTAWFLEAGRLISQAIANEDYRALGYENQKDYFHSEYNIGLSTAHNLMDIWELFAKYKKDAVEAGYTRLTRILPVVRNADEETKIDWLEKAKTLPAPDFENALREAKGKIASDECQHQWKTLKICKICGLRVFEEN